MSACSMPTRACSSTIRRCWRRRQDRRDRRRRVDQGAAGRARIDGRGKTLVPGIWDSHMHIGDDWDVLANIANGMTSFRSPGTEIDRAQSARQARASGDLLMGEPFISAIIDKKDPLAAQGGDDRQQRGRDDRRGAQDQGGGPVGGQILHLDESGVDRARRGRGAPARAPRQRPCAGDDAADARRCAPAMTRSPTSTSS